MSWVSPAVLCVNSQLLQIIPIINHSGIQSNQYSSVNQEGTHLSYISNRLFLPSIVFNMLEYILQNKTSSLVTYNQKIFKVAINIKFLSLGHLVYTLSFQKVNLLLQSYS